jgi:S-adenosylmethionine hydrolase
VPVTVGTNRLDIPFVRTFSDVPLKQVLLYIDSRARVGLAVNHFAATYGIKPP